MLYLAGSTDEAVVVAARVAYTPTLRLLSRDTVVRLGGNLSVSGSFGFTMSPEGKRALTIAPVTTGFQLVVAPNWITEFRRRLAEVRGGRPRQ